MTSPESLPSSTPPASDAPRDRDLSGARMPLAILAGSDRRPAPPARGVDRSEYIVGYKGAEIEVGGRPLVAILVDRARTAGLFHPIYVIGPEKVYGSLTSAEVIDTDGSLGKNLRVAIETIERRHGKDTGIAFLACDVLPSERELRDTMVDLAESLPDGVRGAGETPAMALSAVQADGRLGASAWKPRYGIRRSPGGELLELLPGHLGVIWPGKLRRGLLFRVLELAYRERNRDYRHRRRTIVTRLLSMLLWRDVLNIFRMRAPTLTWAVLRYGLGGCVAWRHGELDLAGLSRSLAGILVHRDTFRRLGENAVRIAVSDRISLAKDIDTRRELDELTQEPPDARSDAGE